MVQVLSLFSSQNWFRPLESVHGKCMYPRKKNEEFFKKKLCVSEKVRTSFVGCHLKFIFSEILEAPLVRQADDELKKIFLFRKLSLKI